MPFNPPILYTPEVESFEEDEQQTVTELNGAFDVILNKTAADYGHAVRSVHAKAHGIL